MDGKEEGSFLKKENERLLAENQKLRSENSELKEKIRKYEAQVFDPGASGSHSVNSFGRINSRDSQTSEKLVDSVQREKEKNSPEQAALFVNIRQIQGSFDQLLSVSESTPRKDVDKTSTTPEKLELFRSLFCGRTDVYAKRYYNMKSQKTGYAPVCANAGRPLLCEKKKFTCGECPNRELIPLSDKVICNHIIGRDEHARDVIGIYPIFPDNTVCFLAIDLDKENWRTDLNAILAVCKRAGICPAVERSRSGEGAHLWFFFEDRIPAATARRLGNGLITLAMEIDHTLKFTSYDRLFPNQDVLPKGGFGNLIALPLQGQAKLKGNSLFVDDSLRPYEDQWAYLSQVKKIPLQQAKYLAEELSGQGEMGVLSNDEDKADEKKIVKPWEKKPASKQNTLRYTGMVRITKANMLYIEKNDLPESLLNRVKRLAAFKNPVFYKAQALRFSTYQIPRIIDTSFEDQRYLGIPRGCESDLIEFFRKCGAQADWDDKTCDGLEIDVRFQGNLDEEQTIAAQALLDHENGVLSAPPGFGKTVIGAYIIANRRVNTLVLVHTTALLKQWKESLSKFLLLNETLPDEPVKRGRKKERSVIGELGAGKNSLNGIIDIAIVASLSGNSGRKHILKNYGLVIADECHHVSAIRYEDVMKDVNSKYAYGLTATPMRLDGHEPIIYMQCGPLRHRIDPNEQAKKRSFGHVVIPCFSELKMPEHINQNDRNMNMIYDVLCCDLARNERIISDVMASVKLGRSPIILTNRYDHAQYFFSRLSIIYPNVFLLSGRGKASEKADTIDRIRKAQSDQPMVLVGIGKYIGEGFDVPRLDTLFLAYPIAWKGNLEQYAGRLNRDYKGKEEVIIYDYVDYLVPVLERMYYKRLKGYKRIGYSCRIQSEPSAKDTEMIYDQNEFVSVFDEDMGNKHREITISSPYVSRMRVEAIIGIFQKIETNNCRIRIITRPANDYPTEIHEKIAVSLSRLESIGINVIQTTGLFSKFVVIDQKIVWFGDVDFLSKSKEDAYVLRFENRDVAKELMNKAGLYSDI